MKRIIIIIITVIFNSSLLIGNPIYNEDFIDIQYKIFEHEHGEKAFIAAQSIMDSIGEPAKFDSDSDKEVIKTQLLKEILLYYYMTGEFDKQLAYMEIADPYYRKTNNLMDLAGCYNIMGISYQRMGQFNEAIHYYNLCSEILEQEGSPVALTNKRYELNNIANIYSMIDECDLAEEMYLKCIELLGDPGTDQRNNIDLASYYMNLAEVQLIRLSKIGTDDPERNKFVQKAVDYAEQSLDLSRLYGDRPEKMANRFITVSKAHFEAGRQKEALAEVDSAMIIIKDHELLYLETAVYGIKGDYAYRSGRFDEAETYYVKALEMAEEYHFDEYRLELLQSAYQSTRKSHPERSIVYLEKCKEWEDSIYSQEQQAMIREYQVKYQTAEKEREIMLEQAKNKHERQRVTWLILALVLFIALTGLLLYLVILRRKQNEDLNRRTKTKDHLFSVVSHDIKAPLEGQSHLLDMICEQFPTMQSDDLLESLQAMRTSSHNLTDKIRNIIYWIKEELRNTEPHPSQFMLHELAQGVINESADQIKAKSLSVTNEIPDDWQGFDDAEIVRMVLQNFLSNAIKFSYPKGEINIKATYDGKRYRVSVTDKGVGISKDKLDKLMKETASSSVGTNGEMGTGIGLYVSRQLMERIGSEIRIDSVEGQGTTVSFTVNKA